MRWWDGTKRTENFGHPLPGVTAAGPGNGFATAGFVLGLVGLLLIGIPLFIGLFFGGIPAIRGVILGIDGIVGGNRIGGRGVGLGVAGTVLGFIALLLVFLGPGTLW